VPVKDAAPRRCRRGSSPAAAEHVVPPRAS
jgi:hypothetical protein